MKVSKVDHTRAAVAVRNDMEPKGLLYKMPQGKIEENLYNRLLNRNEKNIEKYTVFTTRKFNYIENEQGDKDPNYVKVLRGDANFIVKKANELFQSVVKEIAKGATASPKNFLDCLQKSAETIKFERRKKKSGNVVWVPVKLEEDYKKYGTSLQEQVEQAVHFNIKRSLSKETVIHSVCKILISFFQKNQITLKEEESRLLIQALDKDIRKEKQLKYIEKSIQSQNTKVQPVQVDGKTVLALSGAKHPKKKVIFDFLVRYANASQSDQENMLIQMRKWILLFVCGEQAYKEAEEKGISTRGFAAEHGDIPGTFGGDVYSKISDLQEIKEQDKGTSERLKVSKLKKEIAAMINDTLTTVYRKIKGMDGVAEEDMFWIEYIQKEVQKVLLKKNKLATGIEYKIQNRYLCNQVWKNWVSFIAGKYVDMGKGVYHFVMPECSSNINELEVCEVQDFYKEGISSFDYEMIKAEETLERDMAVAVTFAVNNFSRAIIKKESERSTSQNEDVLQYTEKEFEKYCDGENIHKNILQYFGGISKWEDCEIVHASGFDVFDTIKKNINCVRNASYHYSQNLEKMEVRNKYVDMLCRHEVDNYTEIIKDKYYSNNLYRFYPESTLKRLMDELYSEVKERPAQIPAFNRIINKQKIAAFINTVIKGNKLKKVIGNVEDASLFYPAMIFLLKEIYYNAFICNENCKKWVEEAALKNAENEKDKNKKEANKNFILRLEQLHTESFGDMCQQLMTALDLQNNRDHRVNTNADQLKYKHFRILLYNAIYEAFANFIKSKDPKLYSLYDAVREPVLQTNLKTREEFLSGWTAHRYDTKIDKITGNSILSAWYVTSHFLAPRQVNHLAGSMKNYRQFVNDIGDRRNKIESKQSYRETEIYEDVVMVLELVAASSGQISNEVKDYFGSDEEYARHLSKYVDFSDEKAKNNMEEPSCRMLLQLFSENKQQTGDGDMIDIYYKNNVILNRNIVLSKMYGLDICENGWWQKVTLENDILNYYKLKRELSSGSKFTGTAVFEKGRCEFPEEQEKLKKFQNIKNRVELLDVMTYEEILIDLYSQLVSWAYMRERDLLYMQLGVAYLALNYGDKSYRTRSREMFGDDRLNSMEGPGPVNIKNGALLYQLIAMNNPCMTLYEMENGKATPAKKSGNSIGARVGCLYKGYLNCREEVYKNGLYFFENYQLHDYIVKHVRNEIDHFKYFRKPVKSLLELYSEIYTYFFTYDKKLQKSVTFILLNILEKYFVRAKIQMGYKKVEVKNDKKEMIPVIETDINIEKAHSLYMFYNQIKYRGRDSKEDKKAYNDYKSRYDLDVRKGVLKLEARDDLFVKQLLELLSYKESMR